MGVIRTWLCLNRKCTAEFDSDQPNPECPTCECARVQWLPRGGHLAGSSTGIDKTLRQVSDRFGLTDMGQRSGTHAGERAAPHLRQANPNERRYSPMPGFDVPWSNSATAGWASAPYPLRKSFEPGARFSGAGKSIPTEVVAKAK